MTKIVSLLLYIFIIGQSLVAQPEKFLEDSALIWRISKPGLSDTSYLMGTIHLPLKAAFETVDTASYLLQNCKKAFFEIVIDQSTMGEQAFYFLAQSESEKISSILDSSEVEKLMEIGTELMGPGVAVIHQLKPIGVYSIFTLSMLPMDTTNAMDLAYQEMATSKGITIVGLETIEDQFSVLDTLEKYGAKELLLELINDYESVEKEADQLLKAYLNKDLKQIAALVNGEFSSVLDEKVQRHLLDERNENMSFKMIAAAQQESCFFAVGAAHLVGTKGLLNLLESAGFKLEPILN